MSCINSDNIEIVSNKQNECKENCHFNFDYSNTSSCILINKKDYLEIKTDGKNKVSYNKQNIILSDIRFYTPSLHTFDGKHTDGEILLQHSNAGENIIISVPVVVRNGQSDSNQFFSKIAKFVPQDVNEKVNVNVTNWSLNDVMPPPKTPFYHYIGKSPYPPCNMQATTIVFDKDYASTINKSDLEFIRKSIQNKNHTKSKKATTSAVPVSSVKESFYGSMVREGMVNYNKNGVNSDETEEDAEAMECTEYIDGEEEENTESEKKTSNIGIDWSNVMKNPTFIFVIILIVLVIGLGVLIYVLNVFKKKDIAEAAETVVSNVPTSAK